MQNSPARNASASVAGGKVQTGDKNQDLILKLLENEPLHFDELVRKSGVSSSKLGSILSLMEVRGLIKSLDGGYFST